MVDIIHLTAYTQILIPGERRFRVRVIRHERNFLVHNADTIL